MSDDKNPQLVEGEIELTEKKVNQVSEKGKKSVLSSMKESEKAALLYTYEVTPTFYRDHIKKEQMETPTNRRKSTRYTWLTFFPIAFGLQFRKIINIFYIITGILNFFRTIAVNIPWVVIGPTIIIMLLGVYNEFVAEYKRWKDDKKVNRTPVTRLAMPGTANAEVAKDGMPLERATLADVKVGDIIRVQDGEQVAADCILLKVANDAPEAYVKTAALDGERNLKPKLANPMISEAFTTMFGTDGKTDKANLSISCIPPQKELYYFEGRLRACLPHEPEFKMALDLNQFLHRGSFIENSGHVYAMVVYTGVETKLIMNMGAYVFKQSSYEKILNRIMVVNLVTFLTIAFISAIFGTMWAKDYMDEYLYIYEGFEDKATYIIIFFRFYLIVNSFIPLDLLATLELSKMRVIPRFENDAEMMVIEKSLGEINGFRANTNTLTEELAQVEYIFCDKTGTLTQNELRFRGLVLQKGQELKFANQDDVLKMQGDINGLNLPGSEKETLDEFFRCVNLCQDCIALPDEKNKGSFNYSGSSVDEVCLLEMSRDSGVSKFTGRDAETCTIEINGRSEEYGIIKIFPFTSERKAMSIMLKHPTQDKAICYVKGADSSVFPMCDGYGGQGKESGFLAADAPNN